MNISQYNDFMNYYFTVYKLFVPAPFDKTTYIHKNENVELALLLAFEKKVKKANLPHGDKIKVLSVIERINTAAKLHGNKQYNKETKAKQSATTILNEVLYNVPIRTAIKYYELDDNRFTVNYTEELQEIRYKGNLVGITTDIHNEEDFYNMPLDVIKINLDNYERWFENVVVEKYKEWLEITNPNKERNGI